MKNNEQEIKKASAFKVVDSLFEKPGAAKKEPELPKGPQDMMLAVDTLHSFKDHPYGVRDDDEMQELVASIKNRGLDERIKVRPRKEGGYEIISGHRRLMACKKAGMKEIPATVYQDVDDQTAVEMMVDANLHRQSILPSERAKSIKMKMDARSRQGRKDGKTGKRTDEEIAAEMGIGRAGLQRLIRPLYLIDKFSKMYDDGKLSENPAYEISFVPPQTQELLHDYLMAEDRLPTPALAQSLKKHCQELKKQKGDKAFLSAAQVAYIMQGNTVAEIFPEPLENKAAAPPKAQAEKEMPPATPVAGGQAAPPEQDKAPLPPVPFPVQSSAPAAPPEKENAGAPVVVAAGDAKAPESGAPAGAVPPEPPAKPDAAMKSQIRMECIAELREENIILPKSDVRSILPECKTDLEYMVAVKAALVEWHGKKLEAKALEGGGNTVKPLQSIKPPSPPSPPPKPIEPAKTDKPVAPPVTPTPKPTEPGKPVPTPAPPQKPAEPAKTEKTAVMPKGTSPQTVEPTSRTEVREGSEKAAASAAPPPTAPKPVEPAKAEKAASPVAPTTPKPAEPARADKPGDTAKDDKDKAFKPSAGFSSKPAEKDAGSEVASPLESFLAKKAQQSKAAAMQGKKPGMPSRE